LGYNSLRFDDEVTRNCLYRNFYDPYAREWQHGNSRWDIIDVVRAAKALRPDGINWPVNNEQGSRDEGKPSFRLDQLTKANGIAHESAHDALSDVYATIAIAKLVKQQQPKLFHFLQQNRHKAKALELLNLGKLSPVVHISGRYPTHKDCLAVVLALCKHPTNSNGIIVYDLSVDPEPLLSLSAEEIRERVFTAANDLPEGIDRIPLKTVHINKCPVLAPVSVIKPDDEERLNLNLAACYANIERIKEGQHLANKISAVFGETVFEQQNDPDLKLYSGGFFSDSDKQKIDLVKNTPADRLANLKIKFTDQRLSEMLFRYRARNFPGTLNHEETERWREFCREKLTGKLPGANQTLEEYFARIQALKNSADADPKILTALEEYAYQNLNLLGLKWT